MYYFFRHVPQNAKNEKKPSFNMKIFIRSQSAVTIKITTPHLIGGCAILYISLPLVVGGLASIEELELPIKIQWLNFNRQRTPQEFVTTLYYRNTQIASKVLPFTYIIQYTIVMVYTHLYITVSSLGFSNTYLS